MPIIDIKHIVCPVDLSDCSRQALRHAVALAQWYGAQLTVLHVFELFVPPQLLPASPGPMVCPFPSREDLTAAVARFVEPLAVVPVEIAVEEGHVARTIVDVATERQADLVVIGTHGHGGFERFVLGSVAEKVLRKALCPVLVVGPAATSVPPALRFNRILCPVDFSESSIAALRFACSVAKEADARITIQHVLEWAPDDGDSLMDDPELHECVQRGLEALITNDDRMWCEPVARVDCGKPYRKIVEIARDEHIDLIVMGVAGRDALDLMFFGSTTNHVVRQATCPVLTVRDPASWRPRWRPAAERAQSLGAREM
jgi:nucleotide-binding universal stress UspA family protein